MKKMFKSTLVFVLLLSALLLICSCSCSELVKRHTVHFIVDGEEYARTYSDGKSVELPDEPEKEGYDFLGWYFDENTYESKLDPANPGAKFKKTNIYFYAKFEKITEPDVTPDPESPSEPEAPIEPETPTEPEKPENPGNGGTVTSPSEDDVEGGGWTD